MSKTITNKSKGLLKNITIVITGASSGIGKSLSLALAPLKPNLVIVARRENKLQQTAYHLKKQKIKHISIVGDVRNREDRESMIKKTLNTFGRIDVLVNNAGLGKVNLFLEQPEQEIDELIETNVLSLIKLTHSVLPIMKEQEEGHIINLSSTLALLPAYPFAVYCATKSAVKTFSDCIREEVKEYGIKVSTVLPGPYNTEFNQVANIGKSDFRGYNVEKLVKKIVKLIMKPKDNLIQPWHFVPVAWLAKISERFKNKVTFSIAESILKAKKETSLELENKVEKKEEIKFLTH
ncbi:MAG: SDR family NAD(P)-dependent oxidoreductase [Asgard group archaeon]|nr:SDR family NAD(P)-dependent oxidoreductase [Asgard group archaeon]